MQVTHAEESNNYAIMGGGKAREFTIKATSHAFRIMTDALYQDKPYAVARETICNATDAHIMGNCEDRPIEITLSDTQFIVKDYGPGIPDDLIDETYCALFGSTKELDDRQTGGFGLGCKAPFSMTDHFMVISCHKGVKNTYAMTIGNDETGGKPAAQLMHTAKTDDTGLTVIVPIETANRYKMQQAIERTLRDGGIKAIFNGAVLDYVRDYTGLKEAGFGLFEKSGHLSHDITVLFGNVLYPLDEHESTHDVYRELTGLLARTSWQLVLYAPPSSVTPKPDRETLGYNDKTLATINKIAWRAVNLIKQQQPRAVKEYFLETMQHWQVRRHFYAAWRSELRTSLRSPYQREVVTTHVDGDTTVTAHSMETVPAIGAKAVARILAYELLFCGSAKDAVLDKIAAKFYRDHSKSLVFSPSKTTRRWDDSMDLVREQHTYLLRRLMRAVYPVVNARPMLRFRQNVTGKLLAKNFTRMRSSDGMFGAKPELTLAPTLAYATDSHGSGYFLITSGYKPAQVAEIKRRAERMGFHVRTLERMERPAVKVKEDKRVSNFFTAFSEVSSGTRRTRSNWNNDNYYQYPTPTLDAPEAFIAIANKRRRITWRPKRPVNGIGPVQPEVQMMCSTIDDTVYCKFAAALNAGSAAKVNIALPYNKEERDRLLAAGVPRYADALLARARRLIRFDREEHAFLAALSFKRNSDRYYRASSPDSLRLVETLCVNTRLAYAIFMQPYRKSPKLAKIRQLWAELHKFFTISATADHFLDDIERQEFKRAKDEYLAMRADFEPFLPQEMRALFNRIADVKLTRKDVPHLDYLAHIISEPYQIASRLETDPVVEWLAQLIEAEGQRLFGDPECLPQPEIQPTEDESE